MSWNLLERFINSDYFNSHPALVVAYLSRYAGNIGIQYVLCSKLRQFTYEDIEFFLPQLCHLLISMDYESMALEEFMLDLCEESVTAALLTFWLFSSYLHDLALNPTSSCFRTCRRVYNKVQQIVFGGAGLHRDKVTDNVLPVTVLASITLASVAAPFLAWHAGPLAVAQARKPRSVANVISEAPRRSQTVNGATTSSRRIKTDQRHTHRVQGSAHSAKDARNKDNFARPTKALPDYSRSAVPHLPSTTTDPRLAPTSADARPSTPSLLGMPLTSASGESPTGTKTVGASLPMDPTPSKKPSQSLPTASDTQAAEVRMLRANYLRSEMQFLTALENISNRLVVVPKPARLSALRAELALIAQDLPAEVDIPVISPPFLEGGSPKQSKHHRIVRLNPAEATSLNSAEKVPYLLILEVLRDDLDFNPTSEANQRLLAKLMAEGGHSTRLFDLTDKSRLRTSNQESNKPVESVLEPADGDLSSLSLIKDFAEVGSRSEGRRPASATNTARGPSSSSVAMTQSSLSALSTPRTSDIPNSRASSPRPRREIIIVKDQLGGQPDFARLAAHMRAAAQMLTQLQLSESKRPKFEVESIKARIITSMQTLEEQSFYLDEMHGATFDTLMDSPDKSAGPAENDEQLNQGVELTLNPGAGAARMENDEKTAGLQRRGDRDDPSAATFGEEWGAKKERIRRSSPYGWMKNWDLLSVIVKTGADLRQEAFACQLIKIFDNIWQEADVPVWIKTMKILVIGHSSGLIETITDGVSLHSLKRSLTLATIAAGTNPRKRIATLRDHFIKTFGELDTSGYVAAAEAFVRSLAAYSILSYVLQLKDRHNGNILIDNQGHIIHIDFGFMFSISPGNLGFEAAPFKLTQDYIDVIGGVGSPSFDLYKSLCKQAFQALRKHADGIILLVEIMGTQSQMPCFASGIAQVTSSLRQRFKLQLSQEEAERFVETDLIGRSLGSYYTRLYDTFQYRTQGIY